MIKIYQGNCLEILPRSAANYFDTLITDPPYGLEFMGKEWDKDVPGPECWKEFLRVCKPGAFAFVLGGTRTFHRLTCAIEDAGWEIRDCMMWLYGSGFPKSYNIGQALEKKATIGKCRRPDRDLGGLGRDRWSGSEEGTLISDTGGQVPYTTEIGRQWAGYGTALKPAWEPIIVAMAPLDGTFAANAEKHGVAGLWIDGGRIKCNWKKERGESWLKSGHGKARNELQLISGKNRNGIYISDKGRWPANVILDEEAGAMLDAQSGISKSKAASGGVSRFFYCAKASKKERNAGLQGMEEKPVASNTGNAHNVAPLGRETKYQNNHPTVKPLALMEYLCKLSRTPTGGRVLDPFGGSGTTAVACIKTDRDCVVIEKEAAYCEIARKRIEHAEREQKE